MYDKDKFEKHNEMIDDYHKNRIAFLILDKKMKFLTNSTMSHLEWVKTLGIEEKDFNLLTRGYFYQGDLVFYKGNFEYDENVIECAKTFCKTFYDRFHFDNFNVCVGVKIGEGKICPPLKTIGIFKNNNLILL